MCSNIFLKSPTDKGTVARLLLKMDPYSEGSNYKLMPKVPLLINWHIQAEKNSRSTRLLACL